MVWYGMVEVCEGAPVAVSGWVLTDRHDLAPCAANTRLGQPSAAMTGNGAYTLNFAPIDLKPRIWTFQMG